MNFNAGVGTSLFYNFDHLSSVRELLDSSANIQAQYRYDPTGTVYKINESIPSDFEYAGYYSHGRSGMFLTLTRSYSPYLNRWISRDPVGESGDLNLNCYASGRPTMVTDPTGLAVDLMTSIDLVVSEIEGSGAVPATLATATALSQLGPLNTLELALLESGQAGAIGLAFLGSFSATIFLEMAIETKGYHAICDRPVPKNLTECEKAKFRVVKMVRCLNARRAFDARWGRDDQHDAHNETLEQDLGWLYRRMHKACKGCN